MFKKLVLVTALLSTAEVVAEPNWGEPSAAQVQATKQSPNGLTLQQAIDLALSSDDPYLLETEGRAGALEDHAVADAQLPDPKVRLNFANWPTNSFSYTQEPMTQLQLGVTQAFPKGDTLALGRQKRQAEAKGIRRQRELREREIILDTRLNWLDVYYSSQAYNKLAASRQAVSELISVIESMYATGRETSQDILRAKLELSLLDDRLLEVERQADMQRARLARRIGQKAYTPFATSTPVMKHPAEQQVIAELLATHPAAEMQAAKIEAADKQVSIAGEQYKPGWAVSVGYGARGGDRSDFASVGVTMDVPLFTKNRQDRRMSAAKKSRQATRLSRDVILLDLKKKLQVSYTDWQRLYERITLYQSVVLQRAKETTEASLTSYQNGVTDFAELVRSRLAELNAELKLLRLKTDRLKAQSQILFLEGEDNA